MTLKVGDKAPAIALASDTGDTVTLASLKGQTVIVYFYPKDDTSGCTTEACEFRDLFPRFAKEDAVVLGVSPDSVASHAKFKKKYELPFTLLADTEKTVCQAYGVWKEKSMYGRKYMGVERTTFVINGKGVITHIFDKVKPKGHADEVMQAIRG